VTGPDLEVVWPLHRSHYLSSALTADGMVMPMEPASVEGPTRASVVATPDRELAAGTLQADPEASQQRVSDLLGVSRRTIGRMAEADLSTALRDPQVLEGARMCLAETANRGSTVEERDAASAWLQAAARDEHQAAHLGIGATPSR
jgi:hypothetical protein